MEFDQTSTDISFGLGKEVIRIWRPLSRFQGHTGTLKLKFDRRKFVCTLYLEPMAGILPN